MSGIIGHTMYAILGAKAAEAKKLPITPALTRHWASYLCGAYLGCDVQTLPEAICVDTGEEVGYGTVPLDKSPITGGPVKPWSFTFEGQEYRARDIHTLFYGRAHLVFGWSPAERQHTVPWDHLADYASMTVQDAIDLFEPSERKLAYLFGWMAHIVGDAMIKSVRPGLTMRLLDGLYTPANRPIQDLVTYHEVGRRELGLNWQALLNDLSDTPVEPVQLHAMRVSRPRGVLAAHFSNGWSPAHEALARHVLGENRRYLKKYLIRLLPEYLLTRTGNEWQCSPELSRQAGGLTYSQMVAESDRAGLRHALWQIGDEIARLFEQVVTRVGALAEIPALSVPTWEEIQQRWQNAKAPK